MLEIAAMIFAVSTAVGTIGGLVITVWVMKVYGTFLKNMGIDLSEKEEA